MRFLLRPESVCQKHNLLKTTISTYFQFNSVTNFPHILCCEQSIDLYTCSL